MRGVRVFDKEVWALTPEGEKIMIYLKYFLRFGKVIEKESYTEKVASMGLLPYKKEEVENEKVRI